MSSTFRIMATSVATRQFDVLPDRIKQRFRQSFLELQKDPHKPRPGLDIRPMRRDRSWRLRMGRYRALYEVEGDTIIFLRFGQRSQVYR